MRPIFEKAIYPSPVDHYVVEREWRDRGFTFSVFRDPSGQEWNDFTHSTDEFVVVAEGELTISVGDKQADCVAGDQVWIPSGVSHSLKTTSKAGSVWLYGYGTGS